MAATSASDRLRSGVASATPGSAGSDSRETAGTNERGCGLEGDQNPWKDRDAAPRKREPTSRTRRWSKASRPTGTTRVATHGSCAAGGLPSSPRAIPGGSCGCRRTRHVWRRDGRRRPPPHRTRRERPRGRVRRGPVGTAAHSDLPFAAGFSALRGGVLQPPSAVVAEGADQTAWRQRPQRCGAAADEDQTFEGSALRGSGSSPSPSGTGSPCRPPRALRCSSPGGRETQRTPCPVPGRNKPGPRGAEKTVEVVRNHVDGTGRCGLAAIARRLVARRRELVSWRRGVCRESTAAGAPEEGTSKDRVRGRQDHARSAGPRSRGSRAAGGSAPRRARRTRSEGVEADAGSETRRHASVGTPWSRTGNGKRQEGSGEGPRAAAGR